jgi:nucleoprotein TPR
LANRITTQEETHRSELSGQFRLAELWERSCKETQERNKDLENQIEQDQEKYSEEIARWQARVQEEESRLQETQNRVHELESQVEKLEAMVESNAAEPISPIGLNGNRHSTPTPLNRAQFSPSSMSGVFSPSAHAIEKRGRTGMSLTQLYSELHTARQAETVQRRRADKIQEEYEQYREEAERWAPEYQHTIQEFEQQKEDLAQMSINLQNAVSEREEAERQFRSLRNTIMDKERETKLYQHRRTLQ